MTATLKGIPERASFPGERPLFDVFYDQIIADGPDSEWIRGVDTSYLVEDATPAMRRNAAAMKVAGHWCTLPSAQMDALVEVGEALEMANQQYAQQLGVLEERFFTQALTEPFRPGPPRRGALQRELQGKHGAETGVIGWHSELSDMSNGPAMLSTYSNVKHVTRLQWQHAVDNANAARRQILHPVIDIEDEMKKRQPNGLFHGVAQWAVDFFLRDPARLSR